VSLESLKKILSIKICAFPVFGDGENLSFENCGIWDREVNRQAPWRTEIRRPGGGFCLGFLSSPTTVLSFCEFE
jgi:hypothetical protein